MKKKPSLLHAPLLQDTVRGLWSVATSYYGCKYLEIFPAIQIHDKTYFVLKTNLLNILLWLLNNNNFKIIKAIWNVKRKVCVLIQFFFWVGGVMYFNKLKQKTMLWKTDFSNLKFRRSAFQKSIIQSCSNTACPKSFCW